MGSLGFAIFHSGTILKQTGSELVVPTWKTPQECRMVFEGLGSVTLPSAPRAFSGQWNYAAAHLHVGDGDDDFDDCRSCITQK